MQHHNHFNDSTISEILRSFIRYSNEAKDEAYTENTVYIIDTDKTVYVWPGLAWPVRIHEWALICNFSSFFSENMNFGNN